MSRILVVEDHEAIRGSLKSSLELEGFIVVLASSLEEAHRQLTLPPDLILLDWMLPDGQGLDFLKSIREQNLRSAVIFLTARADTSDKVLGLELGANDYVTKPFEMRELIARIRLRLRESGARVNIEANHIQITGSLCIDRIKRKVQFKGRDVELVKKEYDLLLLFAESPEKVFSRDEILNKVWGYDVFPTTRTVDTHVMLLRQKFEDSLIETVRSVGYKLNPL